jgi:hypothetical protein
MIELLAAAALAMVGGTHPVITIENRGCERRCPVFRLELRGDGTAIYDGRHYVQVNRRVTVAVPPGKVRGWTARLAALSAPGACSGEALDRGMTVIHFIDHGRKRTITDQRGCDDPRAGAVRRILAEIWSAAGLDRLVAGRGRAEK